MSPWNDNRWTSLSTRVPAMQHPKCWKSPCWYLCPNILQRKIMEKPEANCIILLQNAWRWQLLWTPLEAGINRPCAKAQSQDENRQKATENNGNLVCMVLTKSFWQHPYHTVLSLYKLHFSMIITFHSRDAIASAVVTNAFQDRSIVKWSKIKAWFLSRSSTTIDRCWQAQPLLPEIELASNLVKRIPSRPSKPILGPSICTPLDCNIHKFGNFHGGQTDGDEIPQIENPICWKTLVVSILLCLYEMRTLFKSPNWKLESLVVNISQRIIHLSVWHWINDMSIGSGLRHSASEDT